MRIPYYSLIAAGALTLGGCAYGDLGYGVGYGGGYGGGYGSYGYADPYYGGGYGSPYYGWYDDYYYPGTGYYVYDSYRRPHQWSDRQRTYWTSHQQTRTTSGNTAISTKPNWSGFGRRSGTSNTSTTPHQRRTRP
jgi:hypothetical protein